ncbi:MAG: helix-turn-helix transcriptional regulator [Actinomycetota bacterium]
MATFRIGEAASILGIGVDTARRWADEGRLPTRRTTGGHRVIDGSALAVFATSLREASPDRTHSNRNRFPGIVTAVRKDDVAAQVEIQAGPFRIVSMLTREAADDLGLEPGMAATAAVKSTNVSIEIAHRQGRSA